MKSLGNMYGSSLYGDPRSAIGRSGAPGVTGLHGDSFGALMGGSLPAAGKAAPGAAPRQRPFASPMQNDFGASMGGASSGGLPLGMGGPMGVGSAGGIGSVNPGAGGGDFWSAMNSIPGFQGGAQPQPEVMDMMARVGRDGTMTDAMGRVIGNSNDSFNFMPQQPNPIGRTGMGPVSTLRGMYGGY